MSTPTLSKKLRSENKKLHGSFYVVMMAVFVTVAISILFISVKGMFGNKTEEVAIPEETQKTIEETSVEKKTTEDTTYTVESGDTLYAIGIKLGVDWSEIAEINDIEPPYSLSTGQELKIPEGETKEE
jgi:LysM repeat protein